jgi:ferrous iron transport protein B
MKNEGQKKLKTVLLIGNPNCGKSAVFSRLTGAEVISSNYPGSTVELKKGTTTSCGEKYGLIDVPGIYSLEPDSKAEEVATKIIKEADVIINVIESTNLERNLNLTLQLLKMKIPMVMALNFWDETKHIGIEINHKKLERITGVPVVPVCAITGEGIVDLACKIAAAKTGRLKVTKETKWKEIGTIISSVQKVFHRHHSLTDRLADLTIKPLTGLPAAAVALTLAFLVIRIAGESLINYVLDPLYHNIYMPVIMKLSGAIHVTFINELLFGRTHEAMTSFGVLTTGIYVPFVSVLPYIFSFYLVLSFLEDSGYLPRLAVLLDTVFHKFGLHGYSSVPIILGLGCKVPALFSLRILESEREKVLTAVLILMSAPCMPQTAMIFSLGSKYSPWVVVFIFAFLLVVSVVTSVLLNKVMKGEAPELFIEIPPYRMPAAQVLAKKLWIRVKDFLFEAVPLIIFGVFVINLLDIIGAIAIIAKTLGRATTFLLGVPGETAVVMVLGFLRKDMSISMLAPLGLNAKQFIVASIFMVLYMPCVATFFTLIKEMGAKTAVKIFITVFVIAIAVTTLLNLVIR